MAGYAAAMDASMSSASEGTSSETVLLEPSAELSVPEPSANGTDQVEDWESQAGEDPDADKTSLSLCMSEAGSKKGKGELGKQRWTLCLRCMKKKNIWNGQNKVFGFFLTCLHKVFYFTGVNLITCEHQGQRFLCRSRWSFTPPCIN